MHTKSTTPALAYSSQSQGVLELPFIARISRRGPLLVCIGVVGLTLSFARASAQETEPPSEPQTQPQTRTTPGSWGYGAELGAFMETADGSVFTLDIYGEKYIDKAFSLGVLGILSPAGDLNQFGAAGMGRFHIVVNERIGVVPFIGFGLFYATFNSNDDIGFYLPIGATGEYTVSPNIAATGTVFLNLHDLNYNEPVGEDQFSIGLMIGLRFQPD